MLGRRNTKNIIKVKISGFIRLDTKMKKETSTFGITRTKIKDKSISIIKVTTIPIYLLFKLVFMKIAKVAIMPPHKNIFIKCKM